MAEKPVLTQFTTGNIDPAVLNAQLDILATAIAACWDRRGTGVSNNSMTGVMDLNGQLIINQG